jgi:hypothetical protein
MYKHIYIEVNIYVNIHINIFMYNVITTGVPIIMSATKLLSLNEGKIIQSLIQK